MSKFPFTIGTAFLVVFLGAILVSCAPESGPSAVDVVGARSAVDSLWTRYAEASDRHDAAAFEPLFEEEAILAFSTAPTVRGRAAIGAFLASRYAQVDATGLHVEADQFVMSDFLAVETGTFAETFLETGAERTERGRFTLIAYRGEDRVWRIRNLTAIADSTSN
jgi:uncharacterized protein (TIGR02246 family)